MAQPTLAGVHVDRPLTDISVAYVQNAENFISNRVFPVVPVDKASNKYFVYDKNDFLRNDVQKRADATESAGSGYDLTTADYSADVWATHMDIGEQVMANYDIPLFPMRDATVFVSQKMMQKQETEWVSSFFTTGVWGTDITGAASGTNTYWSNETSSDPITNIETGKETILQNTGFEPNTLVLGYQVFRHLRHHPDVVDRVKYTSSNTVVASIIGALFEVERVFVAKAVKATNLEGETPNYDFTHGKHAWLGYVNPSPSVLTPSAGYRFEWTGVSKGLGVGVGVRQFFMDKEAATRVEIQSAWDDKVVASDLGYFWNGIVE